MRFLTSFILCFPAKLGQDLGQKLGQKCGQECGQKIELDGCDKHRTTCGKEGRSVQEKSRRVISSEESCRNASEAVQIADEKTLVAGDEEVLSISTRLIKQNKTAYDELAK